MLGGRASSGAIIRIQESSPRLTGCRFVGGEAIFRGALAVAYGGPLTEDCSFEANLADIGGGAIFADHTNGMQIWRCEFRGNRATISYGEAGALFASDCSAFLVDGCTFWG